MDMKGFIYLAGLMFTIITTILTANSIKVIGQNKLFEIESFISFWGLKFNNVPSRCEIISLSVDANNKIVPYSPYAPISQVIYSYTFFYFIYIIAWYNLWDQNVITIILFGLVIIIDWVWNIYNYCNTFLGVFLAFVIGGGWGFLWAYLIDHSGAVKLQYFNGLSNRTICTRPSSQTFICKENKIA
jgi:hypothetical protein